MFDRQLVFISGFATVGKDLFADLLIENLEPGKASKLSFASTIKEDCSQFLYEKCGVQDYNDRKIKESIRPLWLWYGLYHRERTRGQYFIEKLKERIKACQSELIIITDCRYATYSGVDELDFALESGVLVFIDKFKIQDGQSVYTGPANEAEGLNGPTLRSSAQYHVKWQDACGDPALVDSYCKPQVEKFIKWLKER